MSKSRKLITEYYPWFLLGAAFLLLLFLNVFYLENWLDSDMAAEMMFSRLLAEEGRIFASPHWYYSTEFRFLYTHLLMGALFRVCGSWHTIRLLTNVIFYLLLLSAYFYMMRMIPVGKKKKVLGAAVLLLPFSETMMLHMQIGNTYMSHVIIAFFYAGLFLRLVLGEKRKWALWTGYLLLSVICGVSGVRYFLALQCPFLLAGIWYLVTDDKFLAFRERMTKENFRAAFTGGAKRFLFVGLSGFLGALFGYGVNILYVSRAYIFQTYESTDFIDVYQGVFLERAQDAFGSLLMLFGYIPGKSVLSARGLVSLSAFLMLGILGYIAIGARKSRAMIGRFLALLFYSSFLLNSFIFVFTDSTLVPRYYITTLIWLIPLAMVYAEEQGKPFDRRLLFGILAICLCLATAKVSLSMMTTDKNAAKKTAAEELTERGYDFGYATYWNGNIIQELTNGQVETANIRREEDGTFQFFRWSSMERYYDASYHQGAVFLLLTQEEAAQWGKSALLRAGKEVCRTAGYVIYDYDTNEAFLKAMRKEAQ